MRCEEAFEKKTSDVPLTAKGKVIKILADDHEGAHHQRFVIEISPTQTILISHNLERAYRAPVKIGDKVEVHGTYEWNKLGGIIHKTHHDERGIHEDGYINFIGEKSPHRTKNLPG